MLLRVRRYGTVGPIVVVLHGGPGAPGYMAPVARDLARSFRILEPFQRGSSSEPLTVSRHISDLRAVIEEHCRNERPALVGSSWGAMLALAYAAAYPTDLSAVVLIGCGTFDQVARRRFQKTLDERMDDSLRRRLEHLTDEFPDPDEELTIRGALILRAFSYSLATTNQEIEACDARAHNETWQDMMRLQEAGVYPAAFSAICRPVLMLHGCVDPHPGPMIRASLHRHIPQLEYCELEECGHYPWLENKARDTFFEVLHTWLSRTSVPPSR